MGASRRARGDAQTINQAIVESNSEHQGTVLLQNRKSKNEQRWSVLQIILYHVYIDTTYRMTPTESSMMSARDLYQIQQLKGR